MNRTRNELVEWSGEFSRTTSLSGPALIPESDYKPFPCLFRIRNATIVKCIPITWLLISGFSTMVLVWFKVRNRHQISLATWSKALTYLPETLWYKNRQRIAGQRPSAAAALLVQQHRTRVASPLKPEQNILERHQIILDHTGLGNTASRTLVYLILASPWDRYCNTCVTS